MWLDVCFRWKVIGIIIMIIQLVTSLPVDQNGKTFFKFYSDCFTFLIKPVKPINLVNQKIICTI